MSYLHLDDILVQRLNDLIPENKDNTEETLRKINRFKRNIDIFKIHHGLDGNGGLSLQKTGNIYGLTRESIRQITDKLSSSLNMNKKPVEIFDRCLSIINSMVPCEISRISDRLESEKIIKKGFIVDAAINSLVIFNLPLKATKIISANEKKYLVQDKFKESAKSIISLATKNVSHNGAVSLAILSKEVPGINKYIKETYIKDLLNSMVSVTWIDEKWVHFSDKGLNRFISRLDKIFSVYDSIKINVVYQIIKRNWKNGSRDITSVLPKEVMELFISQSKDYSIVNGIVKSISNKNSSENSHTEKEMMKFILASDNLELREKDLEDKVVAGNPKKKYAFSQALNFSVLFHKKEWGLYTISGNFK
jgi:uncharacterized protein YlzI (FlbEa/FlbD family)